MKNLEDEKLGMNNLTMQYIFFNTDFMAQIQSTDFAKTAQSYSLVCMLAVLCTDFNFPKLHACLEHKYKCFTHSQVFEVLHAKHARDI